MDLKKFNITKQCPQIYIYIFTILTSIALASKYNKDQVIPVTVSGAIVTTLLMGVNFCSWKYQWLTWILAGFSIVSAAINLTGVFTTDKKLIKILKDKK